MPIVDPRSDAIVIRIVYDGAPMAGKSTSVRALGRGLGGEVISPAEVSGRTLYFDWLDYTGGLFEGRRIRCQIISVPGQATLAPRRRRLLESADAVVFVGDSTPTGFAGDRAYLGGLRAVLDGVAGPPVGIVFQANKRDHAGAVPIDAVRSMLQELGLRVGVVESIATDSSGIRETFVFAVRLALDRVRELMRTGELGAARPDVDSAEELLADLKTHEDGSLEYAAESGLVHTRMAELQSDSLVADAIAEVTRADAVVPGAPAVTSTPDVPPAVELTPAIAASHEQPAPPDDRVASGLVWPPVDGRLVLHELARARVSLSRTDEGDWTGEVDGGWRLYSGADAVFEELEQGRSVLVQSARNQAAARDHADACCIALAADGHGRHRLWHIERIASLTDSGQLGQH